jgi:peptidoglycan/xylan/chitin deacetylase (PgdA/CDA1 family)
VTAAADRSEQDERGESSGEDGGVAIMRSAREMLSPVPNIRREHAMSGRTALRILVALGVIGGFSACGSEEEPAHRRGDSRYGQVGSPLTPSDPSVPYLDFDQNASDGSIALTFDDGPDDTNTVKVLDILRSKSVKATFFINSNNYTNVASDSTATALVQRMLSDGHDIGNHTAHHADLSLSSTNVTAELEGVDSLLHDIAPGAFQVRLWRAPYGNPWFGPQSRLDYVAPIGAHYGVHIGWNIDSLDADSCGSSSCVYNNVINAVDSGKSGIVLMHSPNQYTVSALPSIIDDLKTRNKKFVKVEALVQAKYKDASRHLFICDSNSDCISGETCVSSHCKAGTSTDAGTDTSTDTASDTSVTDTSVTDTSTGDTSTGDTGSSTVGLCSSLTVVSGTVSNASTACSGTTPVLATVNGTVATWNGKAYAYATYHSPYDAAHLTGMNLTVAYRGDDKTEPLWYWWVHDPTIALPNGWVLVGDNSWAGNWVRTTHTFAISTPSKYVDGAGNVLIRFGTNTSTNTAELDQMILSFSGSSGTTDGGTTDTSTGDTTATDTTVTDTATDSTTTDTTTTDTGSDTAVTDTATGDTGSTDSATVTNTILCSTIAQTSTGSFYGSSSTACSGTTPALATANSVNVGFNGRTGTPKSGAIVTYASGVTASTVKGLTLQGVYIGDDATEPAWTWAVKNVSGTWDQIGSSTGGWAKSWSSSPYTFTIPNPAQHVQADGTVQIRFTTTTSTNDAELDQMVLAVTH